MLYKIFDLHLIYIFELFYIRDLKDELMHLLHGGHAKKTDFEKSS